MAESILNSVKHSLGLSLTDPSFDEDVLMHINGAIAALFQLGVGPSDPVLVVDNTTEWSGLTDNLHLLSLCKQFVYHTTKMNFDAPGTSYLIEANQNIISELTFRIMVMADPYVPEAEETPEEEV